MSIFKRIEVWILLVLTVAGLVFVLLSSDPADPYDDSPSRIETKTKATNKPTETGKTATKPAGPIAVNSTKLSREEDNYIAEISLKFENQSDTPIRAIDAARLITGSGKSLPVFFLAFTGTPPTFPAKTRSDATLRFSLLAEDIVGKLTLDIAGQRSEIKSARSFDPGAIAENQSKTFKQPDW